MAKEQKNALYDRLLTYHNKHNCLLILCGAVRPARKIHIERKLIAQMLQVLAESGKKLTKCFSSLGVYHQEGSQNGRIGSFL